MSQATRQAPADNIRLGILLVVTFCLTIPAVAACVKVLGETVPIPQITWTRFLIQVTIIGIVIALATRQFVEPRPRPLWPLVLRGVTITIGSGLFYATLAIMPLAEATAILFVQPLITTVLSALLLGDRVGWQRLAAVLTGLVGAIIIIGPNFGTLGLGALLPVGAAVCFSCSSLITRKWAAAAGPMMFQFITASTAVALLSLVLGIGSISAIPALTPAWPTAGELLLLAAAGVGSTITNLMLVQSFRIAPPSVLAPFFYVEIISATAIGALVFGHLPGPATALGAALVIAAGLFVWHREARGR